MRLKTCLVILASTAFLIAVPADRAAAEETMEIGAGDKALIRVDCDAGGRTLQQTIDRLRIVKPLDIVFSGTCAEEITIRRDDLTLRGADDTATLVGQVKVIGGVRVTLEDFTVRDTPGDAIAVIQGAAARISGMVLENAAVGIRIEDASADIGDSLIRNHLSAGILNRSGSGSLYGTITVENAGDSGIAVVDGGSFRVDDPDALLESSGSRYGFLMQLNGVLNLNAGTLIARENLADGIRIYGRGTFGQGGDVISENNGGMGVAVAQSGDWVIVSFGTNTTLVRGNGVHGVFAAASGTASLLRVTIEENEGVGLLADANVVVAIINTTIRNNVVADVAAAFGSAVSFLMGSEVPGDILCLDRPLMRGDFECTVESFDQLDSSSLVGIEVPGPVDFTRPAAVD